MKTCLIVCLLLVALQLSAQEDSTVHFWDRAELKIGYLGNLFWNNGLNLGTEYLWKEQVKTKARKKKQKQITNQLLLNGNLGFTSNFASQTDAGGYTNFGLIWRRTNTKGKQISLEVNPLGYYRSFLPETYKVVGGEVQKVFLPGRHYYAPSFSAGLGKLRSGKKRSGSYFGITVMLRTPYNAGTLPSYFLQYGYRFTHQRNR